MNELKPTPETLSALLAAHASATPAAPAIYFNDRPINYAALAERSARLATGLASIGVGAGDRIGVWLPSRPAWLELIFAAARLSAIVVAVNTRFRHVEVADIVGRSGCKILVLAPEFKGIDFAGILAQIDRTTWPALECLVAEGESAPESLAGLPTISYQNLAAASPMLEDYADAEAGAAIFTTSGTTKAPKFVLHAQRGLARHGADVAHGFGFDAADAHLVQMLPFCGVFGFSQAMATLAAGRSMSLLESFDAAAALAAIRSRAATHLFGTDDMYRRILELAGDRKFDTLRMCGFAAFNGDPAPLVAAGDKLNVPFVGLYGMSEVQALFAAQPSGATGARRALAGGVPVSPSALARARDPESGALLAHEQPGELELRGPSLMREYFGDPAATAAAITEDGYVRTGDLGYTTEDGFVFLARMGDALRLGGFLVNPSEIAAVVERAPGVAECQVVAVATGAGAKPFAFVTLHAGAAFDEAAAIALCQDAVAKFKVPLRVVPLDAFPMAESANGLKVQRAKLRQCAQEILRDNAMTQKNLGPAP